MPDVAAAAAYALDVTATIVATLTAAPPVAAALLAGGPIDLPRSLAQVHNVLLPHVQRVARGVPECEERGPVLARHEPLQALVARAVQQLLVHGLLQEPASTASEAAARSEQLVQALMELQVRYGTDHNCEDMHRAQCVAARRCRCGCLF